VIVYGILGEAQSDADTLKVIVRQLANDHSISVKAKGYSCGDELMRKAPRDLAAFAREGCSKFILCYDADGQDPLPRKLKAESLIRKTGISSACVVIPVEEIEAWILADIKAVTNIFPGWNPDEIQNPERIPSPKEYLEKLSRTSKHYPRYSHATHNPVVARHLNLGKVYEKCPSFRILSTFVVA
jgi:hypothetical protein